MTSSRFDALAFLDRTATTLPVIFDDTVAWRRATT